MPPRPPAQGLGAQLSPSEHEPREVLLTFWEQADRNRPHRAPVIAGSLEQSTMNKAMKVIMDDPKLQDELFEEIGASTMHWHKATPSQAGRDEPEADEPQGVVEGRFVDVYCSN